MKMTKLLLAFTILSAALVNTAIAQNSKVIANAYLEITLQVNESDRGAAAGVYLKYKEPFLKTIKGAVSKELLIRREDVQVLHGFKTVEDAEAYLKTGLFSNDIVSALKPLLQASPEVRIYTVFTKK